VAGMKVDPYRTTQAMVLAIAGFAAACPWAGTLSTMLGVVTQAYWLSLSWDERNSSRAGQYLLSWGNESDVAGFGFGILLVLLSPLMWLAALIPEREPWQMAPTKRLIAVYAMGLVVFAATPLLLRLIR
jgi:hypothetical protein